MKLDKAPDNLPCDAVFKGFRCVSQRNIRIVRDNVKYYIGRWYCARTGKSYEASLPSTFRGQIGGELLSFVQMLHHCGNMTQGAISDLLTHLGAPLSKGCISNLLTHSDWVESEQQNLLCSALANAPYVGVDSTMSKESGRYMHTQVICADHFSLYYTQPGKSRVDVYASIQGLSRHQVYLACDNRALKLMKNTAVSKKHLKFIKVIFKGGKIMSVPQMTAIFDSEPIFAKTNKTRRTVILSALAMSYYHQQKAFPVIDYLITDDAHEYNYIAAKQQMICWIHEIRLYRKMVPQIKYHRQILEDHLSKIWDLYAKIKAYKQVPIWEREKHKKVIISEFEVLFSGNTDYGALNERLNLTKAKAKQLLAVLDHPAFPVHNNLAERSIRKVVRKRDISYHTCSPRGTRIRDAFMSLYQTAKQLNISFMDYLIDRNMKTYQMESLAMMVHKAYQ